MQQTDPVSRKAEADTRLNFLPVDSSQGREEGRKDERRKKSVKAKKIIIDGKETQEIMKNNINNKSWEYYKLGLISQK